GSPKPGDEAAVPCSDLEHPGTGGEATDEAQLVALDHGAQGLENPVERRTCPTRTGSAVAPLPRAARSAQCHRRCSASARTPGAPRAGGRMRWPRATP